MNKTNLIKKIIILVFIVISFQFMGCTFNKLKEPISKEGAIFTLNKF